LPQDIRHPLFARFFDRLTPVMEKDLGPFRDQLLAGLEGRVLELGAGNGINFSHYPRTVTEVVAIEPEPYLRGKASAAAARAPVPVTVRAGVAGELDLQPGSVDAAVCSLVLCSVPDQSAALRDLRRVLRAGGQLRFLEHIRGGGAVKPRLQSGLDRSGLWPALVGGCHCGRDTVGAIRQAGFDVTTTRTIDLGPSWLATNPHVLGTATV
jgi:SAM-dependent methyltransferase